MNKLKSTFLRTNNVRHSSDDRRSQQFAKKLNAAHFQSYDSPITTTTLTEGPPTLHLEELTEMERTAYQSWWKDLDPFSIGHLDNEAVLKFLRGCCLPDHKLEQILRFFEHTVDGLNELQFYAMLRLIAHAQNGRTISRDMIFLGAPVPRFQTNAIDALIKPAMDDLATPQVEPATTSTTNTTNTTTSLSKSSLGNTSTWPTATQTTRNSWIDTTSTGCSSQQQQQQQQQQEQEQQRRTSWYVGQQAIQQTMDLVPAVPFMSPPSQQQQQPASMDNSNRQSRHMSENLSTGGAGSNSQQQFNQGGNQQSNHGTAPSAQYPWGQLPLQPSVTTHSIMPTKATTDSNTQQKYTHSRSRSVPYSVPQPPIQTTDSQTRNDQENVFVFDTVAATPTKQQLQQQRPAPLTSRASMDADSFQKLSSAIDTGQSLLLTKKFVPPKASNNPFENNAAIEESSKNKGAGLAYSPFADDSQEEQQEQEQHSLAKSTHTSTAATTASTPITTTATTTTTTTVFPDTPPRGQDSMSPEASAPPWPITKLNDYPNKQNLYPPPVPSQATKPAFLKYARNVVPSNYHLRRTRSYGTRDRAPSDPFNPNDNILTTSTSFDFNDPALMTSSTTTATTVSSSSPSSSSASPFNYPTEQRFGAKLFRHKSDGSSLLRR